MKMLRAIFEWQTDSQTINKLQVMDTTKKHYELLTKQQAKSDENFLLLPFKEFYGDDTEPSVLSPPL